MAIPTPQTLTTAKPAKLRKIVAIKHVGRFLNYSASGDVELKRYNHVFAENGRGKTTLCAILRSLQSGDPSQVIGRTTLGVSGTPDITILLDDRTAVFSAGSWNRTVPNLVVFDSMFVSENVYSGDGVDLSHRRNLYGVIVGEKGVELARRIEELDGASREKSTEIRDKRAAVQRLVPQGLTIEVFLHLQEDATIDTKIAEKERELEAVKRADQIKNRQGLTELSLPTFPESFTALLDKTIERIAQGAEHRVKEQIEKHNMHRRGQPWLSEGLGYIRDNACPFCGQDVAQVLLVEAYRDFFSAAYRDLRTEISNLRELVESAFSDREIARIEAAVGKNKETVEFWMRFCSFAAPQLEVEALGETLRSLRQGALTLLDRKSAAPLDRVEVEESFKTIHDSFVKAQGSVTGYNRAVQEVNAIIRSKKSTVGNSDVRSVENALSLLRSTKRRHESDAKVLCKAYEDVQVAKKDIEDRKAATKRELDKYTQEVMGRYEQAINVLLDDFQAGFRITNSTHGYPGGVASSSYQILINESPVELGDASTPADKPSFKNTLSSGDRSTLALALFLVQLEHDPERANKIVVFDDPFNSQDNFRKDCTVQKIKQCGESSSQVIVLSHDPKFLKRIWDRLAQHTDERKTLQMARLGVRDTRITEWDIAEATQARFLAERKELVDYYNTAEGLPRDIVNRIRPVIETYCRNLYPGDFANDSLGMIIGKIRSAGPSHQLFALLDDLDLLNEYTRRYHHGENPSAATEPINDQELQGFVKRTLGIVGGC